MMTLRYLTETNIKVPRLFMAVPGKSNDLYSGNMPHAEAIWEYLDTADYSKIADEIIIIHAKDDEMITYTNAQKLATQT